MITGYAGNLEPSVPASIASGQTTSAAIQKGGFGLVGIYFPATFSGASISFTACATLGGTYQPVYNSLGLVSYAVVAGQYLAISPADLAGANYFKIVSASSEGALRSLTLALKG